MTTEQPLEVVQNSVYSPCQAVNLYIDLSLLSCCGLDANASLPYIHAGGCVNFNAYSIIVLSRCWLVPSEVHHKLWSWWHLERAHPQVEQVSVGTYRPAAVS